MGIFHEQSDSKLVIVSGTNGAGKDTLGDELGDRFGFMHVSFGDILRGEATRQGKDHKRKTLIDIGVKLREKRQTLGAVLLIGIERWREQREQYLGGLVMTGARVVGEAQEGKDQGGTLVFVDAPEEERYRRIAARKRDAESAQSFEDFHAHDQLELNGVPDDPSRPHLLGIKAIADLRYENIDRSEFLWESKRDLGITSRLNP
jgi:dephospho-CoA kinase